MRTHTLRPHMSFGTRDQCHFCVSHLPGSFQEVMLFVQLTVCFQERYTHRVMQWYTQGGQFANANVFLEAFGG